MTFLSLKRILLLGAFALWCAAGPAAADDDGPPLVAGRLRDAGGYAYPPSGHTLTPLPDGGLLLVGEGLPASAQQLRAAWLRAELLERLDRAFTQPYPEPKRWDARRRGWVRLEGPPNCPRGRHTQHRAVALADGRVWLVGGICDPPRPANDDSPRTAFSTTAFWDPRQNRWQPGPDTAQPRLLHSATALDDGSVVVAGGMADPVFANLPGHAVLRSAQRLAGNVLQALPDLLDPRAQHSATALPGGRLLVAGGFDAQGRALASVELWDAKAWRWQALPPLQQARHAHSAVALKDGRVMVFGGLDERQQALRSVEVFDPAQQRWQDGPELPLPLALPGAAVLAGGQVLVAGGAWLESTGSVPWAWLLDVNGTGWRLAGRAASEQLGGMWGPVAIWPEADGGALLAVPAGFLRFVPERATSEPAVDAPAWRGRPEAVSLGDRQALWVGTVDDDESGHEPQTWRWRAGAGWERLPSPPLGSATDLQLLPAGPGQALLLARSGPDEAARLDSWHWRNGRWQPAAGIERLDRPVGAWVAGRLADGRVALMQGGEHLWVADEQVQGWEPRALKLGVFPPGGAPTRASEPMASFAEGEGPGTPLNELTYRYLARRDALHTPSMAWDAANDRWFYRSHHETLGHEALRLSGGCVLSLRPLAIFDPRDGSVRPQADPGLGRGLHLRRAVVLEDGWLLSAGGGLSADRGGTDALLRAGCDGLAAELAMPRFIDPRLAPPEAAPPPAAPALAPRSWPAWLRLPSHETLAYTGVAALLAFWLGWRIHLARRPQPPKAVSVPAPARRRRAPAARSAWPPFTLLRWFVGLSLVAWSLNLGTNYWLGQRRLKQLDCEEDARACSRDSAGLLKVAPQVTARLGPNVRSELPCPLIGDWLSSRGNQPGYRIELRDDGRFSVRGTQPGRTGVVATGAWAFQGDSLVWQSDQQPGHALDVTPIEPGSLTRFTLREADGSQTRYERLQLLASRRCTPREHLP
jgi:hypothetical protein